MSTYCNTRMALVKKIRSAFWFPPTPAVEAMLQDENASMANLHDIPGMVEHAFETSDIPLRYRTRLISANPLWSTIFDRLVSKLGSGFLVALIGHRGTGKTAMAVQLCRAEIERRPIIHYTRHGVVRYTTAMDVFLSIRATFGTDTPEKEALLAYEKPSLLVIDEIQERSGTDWENRLLTHLIDKRYGEKRNTLLLGNTTAKGLADSLGSSVMSRMEECGGVIKMEWKSFRSKDNG